MANDTPQKPMSRSARRRARYREIAAVVWEERLFDFFRGTILEEQLPAATAGEEPPARERDLPLPVRVRHALERLGPVFIKIGQFLATRGDLLPADLLTELAKLQDDVPVAAWPEMKEGIEAELGAPLEEVYGSFEEVPLAAASIGQVYRASLQDGTPVAVKAQRPGVIEAMELDLEIAHELVERLAKHFAALRELDALAVADEFAGILHSELDYTQEGHSLDRFRNAFADDDSIVFPQVYWDHTTTHVLTMDLLEGVPLTRLVDGQEAPGGDQAHLVQIGVGAYFRMIFQMGFYHADPHAGNLFALPEGRLGFVDFGRVATVSERNREGTFDIIMAVYDDDATGITEAALAMTGMPPRINMAEFEIDIRGVLAQYRHEQATGKGLNQLMQGLLRLMRSHRLHVPTELTVLLTTIGVLEGVAIEIDPSFRMMDVTKPFARKLLPERYGLERLIKGSLRAARAYGRFFDELPVHATRVLRRMSEGEFEVAVRAVEYEALVDRLTAGFYLVAYALIVGALIVGFALLVNVQDLSRPEHIVYRLILFAAIASGIWLLVKSLSSEWRKSRANRRQG